MKEIIALCLVLMATASASTDYTGWPKAIYEIPKNHAKIDWGNFYIHYFIPIDPDIQMAGGSGGPIGQIDLKDKRTGKHISFCFQTVGVRVLERFRGYPQFETWSKAGGETWCRTLYRYAEGSYVSIKTDEFTAGRYHASRKDIVSTLPGYQRILYYVETRYPTKE